MEERPDKYQLCEEAWTGAFISSVHTRKSMWEGNLDDGRSVKPSSAHANNSGAIWGISICKIPTLKDAWGLWDKKGRGWSWWCDSFHHSCPVDFQRSDL